MLSFACCLYVIITLYAPIFEQKLFNFSTKFPYLVLALLKSFLLWTLRKKITMNESSNVRLYRECWTYWKSPPKQEKHWYKIKCNSIKTGTSENIFWSNSGIQMWFTSKNWESSCHKNLKSDSHLPKKKFICFNDSPSKMMKNASYFILKALFIFKIFKLLSCVFRHVEKTAWLEK